ncbi:MAG: class I SAM-dependent methyltransferase [Candidatus Magasanikbacteria bacterium]|mgnify:FL=1|jgi:cyclopropane fatty-acyl-phospholipid synthase-like methyltransferase|nr:class I SAM-dependent methyltransferase [Candidatus Magasanikbacteria bacterium]MBT4221437.1 class I SAM-dependent methyltransferase [Candidatus Magasanikbacteria bacterium]MBT4350715.1 class I SAM-dependent methyltransferase [Candidatus Magasanikbacteria bacterium]MBT4541609.1 class I SAM-dependent methyltransferase [Candidatus Magasanikbacteria bacterium]MBT6252948.1 class I SAM-dependent methyltransferase [Candidatus Magasanikbacteria bacterium]
MAQTAVWEKEYNDKKLLAFHHEPQKDTLRFIKYLKKTHKVQLDGKTILDLGSGTGRNGNYMAKKGGTVHGIEISQTAIKIANEQAHKLCVEKQASYYFRSFGEPLSFEDNTFDIVIDVTSSNSLNEKERETYIKEVQRVLKPQGFFFLKTLCKDGDKNAKNLLKMHPGKEVNTYIMPDINLVERVFSESDIISLYGNHFEILKKEKKTTYSKINNQPYKRNFWIVYMQKS